MAAKYLQIAQLVRTQVKEGEYIHRPLPSERQIAQSFGVSHMTARKATQALLSDGTLTRLDNGRLAARKQVLKKIKGPKIALVSPSFDSESLRKVHMALEEVVDQRHGLLRPMGFTKLYDTIISEVLEADYDGIFLLPPREPMSPLFLNLLKKYASRLAIVFRDMTEDGLMSLGYCGPHDVEKVWDHLYDLGHRQIAYLNTEPDSQHQQPIHELFHTWCVKRNVQAIIINEPVENFQYADVKAYAVMMQHLKRGTLKDCTAVFAHNMNIARAAIRALHEHGITIGPQMSICTQDLPRIAQLTTPSITTLDLQPMNPLIEQVLDWFAAGDKQVPPSKMLYHPNVNVLVGESTVRPSKHQSQRDCSTDN